MLLAHARALAHTEIYRLGEPLVKYHKADAVPDELAEDWEPIQSPPTTDAPAPQAMVAAVPPATEEEDAAVPYDCGCGTPTGG